MVIRFPQRPPAPKDPAKQLGLFPRELSPREVEHRLRMFHHLQHLQHLQHRRLGARP